MKMTKGHRVVFMGTPEFAVPSLKALISDPRFTVVAVVTQPDKPVGRKQIITPSPVKVAAETANIPVFQPNKVKNNPEFWQRLRELNPNVIVVAAYGKILPQEVLDIPRYGVVNLHASFLPKYRGASPIAAAILAGDSETGITLMKMVLAMDEGPIIAKSKPVNISSTDTTASLTAKLATIGAKTLLANLPNYLSGELTPRPQSETEATYTKLLTKADGQIDWQQTEDQIDRQIRAYSPWPGASTHLGNVSVKIITAEMNAVDNPKGTIKKIGPDMFIGKLIIRQLQPAGGKVMSGSAFLAGYSELIGQSVI